MDQDWKHKKYIEYITKMVKLEQDITKTLKAFQDFKDKTTKKLEELCTNVKMTPPLTKNDNTIIELLLPFFDPNACYYADNCIDGLYEFHEVSNEDNIYSMLCMINHPDYKWVCDDNCERSTNGLVVSWKLEKD